MKNKEQIKEALHIKSFLFVFLTVVSLSSCQEDSFRENLSAEEVARLVIEYKQTMNEKGLNGLLCKKCSVQPYKRVHLRKSEFARAYEKENIDFYDPNSHDFSEINCGKISQDGAEINLECKGRIIIYKRNRSVASMRYIDRKLVLYIEDNRLTICPPICDKK